MKNIVVLIAFFLSYFNLFAQNEVQDTNHYAVKAIRQAVCQYHQQKRVGYKKHMVIRMKIMKINKTSGEFVLNYISNDYEFDNLCPSHYARVDDELVLIKVDGMCKTDPTKYGINRINEATKIEALDILAGPNLIITGQGPPYMLFKYKKNKIKSKFYLSYHPDKKYRF